MYYVGMFSCHVCYALYLEMLLKPKLKICSPMFHEAIVSEFRALLLFYLQRVVSVLL